MVAQGNEKLFGGRDAFDGSGQPLSGDTELTTERCRFVELRYGMEPGAMMIRVAVPTLIRSGNDK